MSKYSRSELFCPLWRYRNWANLYVLRMFPMIIANEQIIRRNWRKSSIESAIFFRLKQSFSISKSFFAAKKKQNQVTFSQQELSSWALPSFSLSISSSEPVMFLFFHILKWWRRRILHCIDYCSHKTQQIKRHTFLSLFSRLFSSFGSARSYVFR